MNRGRTVFAQLLEFVPFKHFEYLVERDAANNAVRHFTAWTHFLCMAYAQLTRRDGLRDLVACLNCQRSKLYHIGIRGKISRSTLADANERRDWRLFEALGQRLIATAVELYHGQDSGLGLKEPLYAMDSTTIDLCLTLFPWADFRSTKAAVKAHTIIDLRGAIPVAEEQDVYCLTLPSGRQICWRERESPGAADELQHVLSVLISAATSAVRKVDQARGANLRPAPAVDAAVAIIKKRIAARPKLKTQPSVLRAAVLKAGLSESTWARAVRRLRQSGDLTD